MKAVLIPNKPVEQAEVDYTDPEDKDGTYQPNECIFALGINPYDDNEIMISIMDKESWDRDHYLSDQFGNHSFAGAPLPADWNNITDSIWVAGTYRWSIDLIRAGLVSLGFVESKELTDFLART